MRRTAAKVIPSAPHEVLLVLDATTGQNGLEQARKFTESSGVTGIVLTKLDGTAKGGSRGGHRARVESCPSATSASASRPTICCRSSPTNSSRPCSRRDKQMMRDPLMDEALELARRGLGRTSPNPAVGAVLVQDGEIVGRGFHTYAQAKHAEDGGAGRGRRSRARGHALRHARAVFPSRPHAALRRCIGARRHRKSDRGHGGSQSARSRAKDSAACTTPASKWKLPSEYAEEARAVERSLHPLHAHRPAAGDA